MRENDFFAISMGKFKLIQRLGIKYRQAEKMFQSLIKSFYSLISINQLSSDSIYCLCAVFMFLKLFLNLNEIINGQSQICGKIFQIFSPIKFAQWLIFYDKNIFFLQCIPFQKIIQKQFDFPKRAKFGSLISLQISGTEFLKRTNSERKLNLTETKITVSIEEFYNQVEKNIRMSIFAYENVKLFSDHQNTTDKATYRNDEMFLSLNNRLIPFHKNFLSYCRKIIETDNFNQIVVLDGFKLDVQILIFRKML